MSFIRGLLDLLLWGWQCALLERIRPGAGHQPLIPQPSHCRHCGRHMP